MSKAAERGETFNSLSNHGKTVVNNLPAGEQRKLLDAIRKKRNDDRVLGEGMRALVEEALKK